RPTHWLRTLACAPRRSLPFGGCRSEEHTSELQSLTNLVCRLLLEKKKEDFGTFADRLSAWAGEVGVVSAWAPVCLRRPSPRLSPVRGGASPVRTALFFFLRIGRPPKFPLFPYPPLFR